MTTNPVAVRHKGTGRFLGRGRGTSRKWVERVEEADLWDVRGPGMNAVEHSVSRYKRTGGLKRHCEYVEVRLEVVR